MQSSFVLDLIDLFLNRPGAKWVKGKKSIEFLGLHADYESRCQMGWLGQIQVS